MEVLGCKKKTKRTLISKMSNLRLSKRKASKVILPKAFSIKDGFPPVYSQNVCSCTSNAVCGCDHFIYHRDSTTWDPSTIFAYYNQKRKEKPMIDDGSTVEDALKVCKKYGVCSSKVWSNENPFNKKPSKEAYQNGLKGKEIKKWYEVKNFKQIKQALVSGYPVAVAVTWCFNSIDPITHIMNTPTEKEAKHCYEGHAIIIVGYDDDKKLFEFRNSWSDKWGNKGYGYFTYETLKRVIWYDDSYAVTY